MELTNKTKSNFQIFPNEMKMVKKIHIVAIENEVKELLWEIKKDYTDTIIIKTINLTKANNEIFEFELFKNKTKSDYNFPQKYLMEPNSAIMKSGGFDEVGLQFNIDKLHLHSHLYTANEIISFPGRVFEIIKKIPYQKSEMKIFLENKKANITTRNFPESVAAIRKKWKIKDGGNVYCFFTTDLNNAKIVLICTKIN